MMAKSNPSFFRHTKSFSLNWEERSTPYVPLGIGGLEFVTLRALSEFVLVKCCTGFEKTKVTLKNRSKQTEEQRVAIFLLHARLECN